MRLELAADIDVRINDLRRALDLTQEQFGVLAGVRKAQVSQWERGEQAPNPASIRSICRHTGLPLVAFQDAGPTPVELVNRFVNDPSIGRASTALAEVRLLVNGARAAELSLLLLRVDEIRARLLATLTEPVQDAVDFLDGGDHGEEGGEGGAATG